MTKLVEIQTEVQQIIKDNPVLETRAQALMDAGYADLKLCWIKNGQLGASKHLKKKGVFRIQISYQFLEKGYPAAWCIDIPDTDIDEDYVDLPF